MSSVSPQVPTTASAGSTQPRSTSRSAKLGEQALFLLAAVAALLAPAALVLVYLPAPPVAVVWDAANLFGFAGLGCLVLLFAFPARPSAFPRLDPAFFARFHRALAYATVGVLLLHAVPLLIAEPLTLEYVKLSAPWYMLAGLAAFVLIVIAVVTAIQPVRRRLWATRRSFRAFHSALSLTGITLTGAHILGSGYYPNSLAKQLALATVVAAAMAVTALSWRRAAETPPRASAPIVMTTPRTATTLLALALLAAAAALSAWMLGVWLLGGWRAEP